MKTDLKQASKIFIFDFDGTIADTFETSIVIINRLSAQFNYKRIEPHEVNTIKDLPAHKIVRYLRIPIVKLPMILAKGREAMRSEIDSVQPSAGLSEVLQVLYSKNLPMGILTSNSLEVVNDFLRRNKLQFFGFIHGYSSIWGKAKLLKSLMDKYHLSPNDLVYIGDETRDIQAAKRLGVRSAAVTWGYNSYSALKACTPDYLIDHPTELLHISSTKTTD